MVKSIIIKRVLTLAIFQFFHFKKMVRESGKSNIKAMKIMKQSLKTLIPSFKEALEQLPDVLKVGNS